VAEPARGQRVGAPVDDLVEFGERETALAVDYRDLGRDPARAASQQVPETLGASGQTRVVVHRFGCGWHLRSSSA
jgi:hypothetical protein